jgi:uncharacterized protein
MTAATLLDVNVLVALCDGDHVHHQAAALWFATHAEGGWASCPLTQNGVVRVMSAPSYPNPKTVTQMAAKLQPLIANRHHHFWLDNLSIVDATLFKHDHLIGHRQITDSYLLALAVKHGGRFLTIDGGVALNTVAGAKDHHLVALLPKKR